jgi:hypothetical protein
LQAVEEAFGADIDYAMLVKLYGTGPATTEDAAGRHYSPAECIGTRTNTITGDPDPKHVSTSYAERANLTMRMSMRRFTRLTNAFSKKLENHAHMVALYALWYNFVRVHKTLRVAPAMAAGIESRLWAMEDVVRLIDEHAERTAPRLADRLVVEKESSHEDYRHFRPNYRFNDGRCCTSSLSDFSGCLSASTRGPSARYDPGAA